MIGILVHADQVLRDLSEYGIAVLLPENTLCSAAYASSALVITTAVALGIPALDFATYGAVLPTRH